MFGLLHVNYKCSSTFSYQINGSKDEEDPQLSDIPNSTSACKTKSVQEIPDETEKHVSEIVTVS